MCIRSYLFMCLVALSWSSLFASMPIFDKPWLQDMTRSYDILPADMLTPEQIVDELFALYAHADEEEYIGEAVSQLAHALQAAQQALQAFDEKAGIDEETVIAALFHDIGHRYTGKNIHNMDGFGIAEHDKIGAALLATRGFSAKVVRLVAGHVDAKRYRVFKDKKYHEQLTFASQQTLVRQGGPMTAHEAEAFENDPYFEQILLMRSWDENAKAAGAPTPPLSFYKSMILRHLKK